MTRMPFAPRSPFVWQLRSRLLALGERTLIAGILNVTPDSFSDGGLYRDTSKAVDHGLRMLDEGADILDIGGESTRPGEKMPVSATEEQDRLLPVIEALLQERPQAILSIDTYKASTATAAVAAGAEIVNDVSGFLWDEAMAAACASMPCGVVLMHARGKPEEWRSQMPLAPDAVVPLVKHGLEERLQAALDAGIAAERIVLDPGYGFGKRLNENYPLLAHQDALLTLGRPLLAGVSRKSFLTKSEALPETRLHATLAATTAAILAGAHLVRVHDVRAAVDAAHVADRILGN